MLLNLVRTFDDLPGYSTFEGFAAVIYQNGTQNPSRLYTEAGVPLSSDGRVPLADPAKIDVWVPPGYLYTIRLLDPKGREVYVVDYVAATAFGAVGAGSGGVSGLTKRQTRILDVLFQNGFDHGVFPSPSVYSLTPLDSSVALLGEETTFRLVGDNLDTDNITLVVDWGDGGAPETIAVRVDGVYDAGLLEYNDTGDMLSSRINIKHTYPLDVPAGSVAITGSASNDWSETTLTDISVLVTPRVTEWSFALSTRWAALSAPTQASLSDEDTSTSVIATRAFSEDPNPRIIVDFGKMIVPAWMIIGRLTGLPGSAYDGSSPEYSLQGRKLEYGVPNEFDGIDWTTDPEFEGSDSAIASSAATYSKEIPFACRYLRFSMGGEFDAVSNPTYGVGFGYLSFSLTAEPPPGAPS